MSATVLTSSYTDLAGNLGTGNNVSVSIAVDKIAPTVTISTTEGSKYLIKAGSTVEVVFTFNETIGLADFNPLVSAGAGTLGARYYKDAVGNKYETAAAVPPGTDTTRIYAVFTPTPNASGTGVGGASVTIDGRTGYEQCKMASRFRHPSAGGVYWQYLVALVHQQRCSFFGW
jgi:hypothetical protein